MSFANNPANEPCDIATIDFDTDNEWQYRYNPSGEREQKRMYKKAGMTSEYALPWEYYQLGANNEQLVVYHGINLNSLTYQTAPQQIALNPVSQHSDWGCTQTLPQSNSAIFIYPVEFNITAPGFAKMRLVLDDNGNWKKQFMVGNQVGSNMAVLESENVEGTIVPKIVSRYQYGPYGEPISYENDQERQGFIGKERDLESNLADHGVRKYDYMTGRSEAEIPTCRERFTSADRCGRSITDIHLTNLLVTTQF